MDVHWITAFLDLPAPAFDHGVAFWEAVTGSTLSPQRGAHDEFATLLPPDGDAYLRVQRIGKGAAGIHVDLHASDVPAAAAQAVTLGARVLGDHGYVTLASPGKFRFCIVAYHGEATRPRPVVHADTGSRNRTVSLVDQVCLDVAPDIVDREAQFWAALTGWEHSGGALPELSYLVRPVGMPLRIIVQALADPATPVVRAHLDLACGSEVEQVAATHERLGARPHHDGPAWRTMIDPAGLHYCLTRRDPTTGTLAASQPARR